MEHIDMPVGHETQSSRQSQVIHDSNDDVPSESTNFFRQSEASKDAPRRKRQLDSSQFIPMKQAERRAVQVLGDSTSKAARKRVKSEHNQEFRSGSVMSAQRSSGARPKVVKSISSSRLNDLGNANAGQKLVQFKSKLNLPEGTITQSTPSLAQFDHARQSEFRIVKNLQSNEVNLGSKDILPDQFHVSTLLEDRKKRSAMSSKSLIGGILPHAETSNVKESVYKCYLKQPMYQPIQLSQSSKEQIIEQENKSRMIPQLRVRKVSRGDRSKSRKGYLNRSSADLIGTINAQLSMQNPTMEERKLFAEQQRIPSLLEDHPIPITQSLTNASKYESNNRVSKIPKKKLPVKVGYQTNLEQSGHYRKVQSLAKGLLKVKQELNRPQTSFQDQRFSQQLQMSKQTRIGHDRSSMADSASKEMTKPRSILPFDLNSSQNVLFSRDDSLQNKPAFDKAQVRNSGSFMKRAKSSTGLRSRTPEFNQLFSAQRLSSGTKKMIRNQEGSLNRKESLASSQENMLNLEKIYAKKLARQEFDRQSSGSTVKRKKARLPESLRKKKKMVSKLLEVQRKKEAEEEQLKSMKSVVFYNQAMQQRERAKQHQSQHPSHSHEQLQQPPQPQPQPQHQPQAQQQQQPIPQPNFTSTQTNKNVMIPGFYSNHIQNLTINTQPGFELQKFLESQQFQQEANLPIVKEMQPQFYEGPQMTHHYMSSEGDQNNFAGEGEQILSQSDMEDDEIQLMSEEPLSPEIKVEPQIQQFYDTQTSIEERCIVEPVEEQKSQQVEVAEQVESPPPEPMVEEIVDEDKKLIDMLKEKLKKMRKSNTEQIGFMRSQFERKHTVLEKALSMLTNDDADESELTEESIGDVEIQQPEEIDKITEAEKPEIENELHEKVSEQRGETERSEAPKFAEFVAYQDLSSDCPIDKIVEKSEPMQTIHEAEPTSLPVDSNQKIQYSQANSFSPENPLQAKKTEPQLVKQPSTNESIYFFRKNDKVNIALLSDSGSHQSFFVESQESVHLQPEDSLIDNNSQSMQSFSEIFSGSNSNQSKSNVKSSEKSLSDESCLESHRRLNKMKILSHMAELNRNITRRMRQNDSDESSLKFFTQIFSLNQQGKKKFLRPSVKKSRQLLQQVGLMYDAQINHSMPLEKFEVNMKSSSLLSIKRTLFYMDIKFQQLFFDKEIKKKNRITLNRTEKSQVNKVLQKIEEQFKFSQTKRLNFKFSKPDLSQKLIEVHDINFKLCLDPNRQTKALRNKDLLQSDYRKYTSKQRLKISSMFKLTYYTSMKPNSMIFDEKWKFMDLEEQFKKKDRKLHYELNRYRTNRLIKLRYKLLVIQGEKAYLEYEMFIDYVWKNKQRVSMFIQMLNPYLIENMMDQISLFNLKSMTNRQNVYQMIDWQLIEAKILKFQERCIQSNIKFVKKINKSLPKILSQVHLVFSRDTQFLLIKLHEICKLNAQLHYNHDIRVFPIIFQYKTGVCTSSLGEFIQKKIMHETFTYLEPKLTKISLCEKQKNEEAMIQKVERQQVMSPFSHYLAQKYLIKDQVQNINEILFSNLNKNVYFHLHDYCNDISLFVIIQQIQKNLNTSLMRINKIRLNEDPNVFSAKNFVNYKVKPRRVKSCCDMLPSEELQYNQNQFQMKALKVVEKIGFNRSMQDSEHPNYKAQYLKLYQRQNAVNLYDLNVCEQIIQTYLQGKLTQVKDAQNLYYKRVHRLVQTEKKHHKSPCVLYGYKCKLIKVQGMPSTEIFLPIEIKVGEKKIKKWEQIMRFIKKQGEKPIRYENEDVLVTLARDEEKKQRKNDREPNKAIKSVLPDEFLTDSSMEDVNYEDVKSFQSSYKYSDCSSDSASQSSNRNQQRKVKKRKEFNMKMLLNSQNQFVSAIQYYKNLSAELNKEEKEKEAERLRQEQILMEEKRLRTVYQVISEDLINEKQKRGNAILRMQIKYKVESMIKENFNDAKKDNFIQLKQIKGKQRYFQRVQRRSLQKDPELVKYIMRRMSNGIESMFLNTNREKLQQFINNLYRNTFVGEEEDFYDSQRNISERELRKKFEHKKMGVLRSTKFRAEGETEGESTDIWRIDSTSDAGSKLNVLQERQKYRNTEERDREMRQRSSHLLFPERRQNLNYHQKNRKLSIQVKKSHSPDELMDLSLPMQLNRGLVRARSMNQKDESSDENSSVKSKFDIDNLVKTMERIKHKKKMAKMKNEMKRDYRAFIFKMLQKRPEVKIQKSFNIINHAQLSKNLRLKNRLKDVLKSYNLDFNLELPYNLDENCCERKLQLTRIIQEEKMNKIQKLSTLLFKLIKERNLTMVKAILERYNFLNPNKIFDQNGNSLLHAATALDNVEIVKYLLQRGMQPSLQNYEGNTALHFAVSGRYAKIIDLLLDHMANEQQSNNDGVRVWQVKQVRLD